MIRLEILNAKITSRIPEIKVERIKCAYLFADKYIEKKVRYFFRKSYLDFVLDVLETYYAILLDENCIIALILHGLDLTKAENRFLVSKEFGEEVEELIVSLQQLDKLKLNRSKNVEYENYRNFFLVLAKDLRVVMIKLALVLYYLQFGEHTPEEKKNLAREAQYIYAQSASRLGIYELKSKLEDLSFRYLYPFQYREIVSEVHKKERDRENDIERMTISLGDLLKKENIEAEVYGRVKHYYGIYSKLKRKGRSTLDDILDFFALRIVLPDIEKYGKPFYGHCYNVLSLVHNYFKPVPNRFKDYISNPKPNGYSSLHTTVTGFSLKKIKNTPVELQIRTKSMDEEAKYGIAAHWLYKSYRSLSYRTFLKNEVAWVDTIKDFQEKRRGAFHFRDGFKLRMFTDRIFVLSKEGTIYDLPEGSSAVDFAYAVDLATGHHCSLVKVNDKLVPLDYALSNSDVVEIITKQNVTPNMYWLSFVKTERAKTAISLFYEHFDRDHSFRTGKSILESYLNKNKSNFAKSGYENRRDLIEKLGRGEITVSEASKVILPELKTADINQSRLGDLSSKILVSGMKNIPTNMALCCNPSFGDYICGYITRGRGITVHRTDCEVLQGLEKERLLEIKWDIQVKNMPQGRVKLHIKVYKTATLLNAIISFLLLKKAKIEKFSTVEDQLNLNILDYLMEVILEERNIDFLVERLKSFDGVITVYYQELPVE